MPRRTRIRTVTVFALSFAVMLGLNTMPASSAPAPQSDAELTREECGACHFPYARNWLPAYSWKRILDHLDDHFGENAMLDPKTRERVASYLIGERPTDIPIRITQMDWWQRAHGGPAIYTFALQRGVTVSNCESCHR